MRTIARWIALGVCTAVAADGLLVSVHAASQREYQVGIKDILSVAVWGRPELSGKFDVDAEGTVQLPLIERVKVAGLTLRGVEEAIRDRLTAGYLRNPQVSVTVEQYRSQRVMVQGAVAQPGAYPLTGETTLLEVLAQAGSVTADASGDIIVMRAGATAAATPGDGAEPEPGAAVRYVDLAALQKGTLSENLVLQNGDTVIVPTGEKVFVTGFVASPGAYSVRKGTTVRQALILAGGVNERGAEGRVRIIRTVDGKETKLNSKLHDEVQAGDIIVVPPRYF
jgi:polysaccharide export outer membrane protein